MVCLAPRALEKIVRPRRLAGVVVRPLNFTVRRLMTGAPLVLPPPHHAGRIPRPIYGGHIEEPCHATQTRIPRRQLLSRPQVRDGRASPPRLTLSAVTASSAVTRSLWRSSAAMTHVRVSLGADFKNCCMRQGLIDGSERDYFFQRLIASSNPRLERP